MRRYNIISGILLIHSIIDFALAAPVLVQEKRQSCIDVVHIPKDVVAVLGKRGDEELEKLAEELFKTWEKPPVEASPVHASSSSAVPGPDHGSTNVVQAPAPNPASSTPNPDPLMEPSGPPAAPMEDPEKLAEEIFNTWGKPVGPSDVHASLNSAQPGPDHGATNVPAPNPASSTANPDPLMEPSGPSSTAPKQGDDEFHGKLQTLLTKYGSDHELTGAHVAQANPNKRPLTDPVPDFDWNYWMNLEDSQPPGPAPPKRPKYKYEVQQPNPGPSDPGYSNPRLPDDYFQTWKPQILDSSDIHASSSSVPDHGSNPNPRLPDEYFQTWKPLILDSSDVHASSSSAPPRPDHGSTNVAPAPSSNPASSTANPDPLMEPSGLSSTAVMQGYDELHERLQTLLAKYRSDRELTGAHAPQPNPNKRPLTDPDPAEFDWNFGTNLEDPPPPGLPPPKRPNPGPSTDSHFDWDYWMNLEDPPPPKPASPNEIGQAHGKQVEHVQQSNPGPSTKPEQVVNLESPIDSDSEPEDLQAAIYAAKGKAKESRRVSGTARDIGNAAQREFNWKVA